MSEIIKPMPLTGSELKRRINSMYGGRFSTRYNKYLQAMILRLERMGMVEEYKCSGFLTRGDIETSIRYNDGSSVMCNGRSEVCAKMILRSKLSPTGNPCHIPVGFFKLWPLGTIYM